MARKIYISGPISGHNPDIVRVRFATAMKVFENGPFEPLSPLENGLPDTATYDEHMLRDLEMLSECSAIYMLKGWEKSKGCKIEFAHAVANKISIIFEQ